MTLRGLALFGIANRAGNAALPNNISITTGGGVGIGSGKAMLGGTAPGARAT